MFFINLACISNDASFELNEKFDTVFVGYNSFLHLLKNENGEACLASVKKTFKKK